MTERRLSLKSLKPQNLIPFHRFLTKMAEFFPGRAKNVSNKGILRNKEEIPTKALERQKTTSTSIKTEQTKVTLKRLLTN